LTIDNSNTQFDKSASLNQQPARSVVFVLDNYDSFTYNLVQYLGEIGREIIVHRNDRITIEEIAGHAPTHIVISPGPGTPDDAGISLELISRLGRTIPTLGVCLGHQAIGQVFGASVVRAGRVMHGKTAEVIHDGRNLHAGLRSPFTAMRYHSLILDPPTIPAELRVTARTADGEVMAIEHESFPLFGVQYHPESIMTEHGRDILKNFLAVGEP
jgi:anthranilate synthase/aminodeoxychorismate synthase-like glutamine amidotransferase